MALLCMLLRTMRPEVATGLLPDRRAAVGNSTSQCAYLAGPVEAGCGLPGAGICVLIEIWIWRCS